MNSGKYVKKPRVVIGHGDGEMASRPLDMAFKRRHGNVRFEAIDPAINEGKISRFFGTMRKQIPSSRITLINRRSLERLQKIESNSVDHQWAVSVVCCMPFVELREFYSEIFRTLKPGGRLSLVNVEYVLLSQVKLLQENGFRVSLKRLTWKEMDALGDNIHLHEVVAKKQSIPADLRQEAIWHALQYGRSNSQDAVDYYYERLRAQAEGKTGLFRLTATKPRK
jgi:SAM-dependent methyltransferase